MCDIRTALFRRLQVQLPIGRKSTGDPIIRRLHASPVLVARIAKAAGISRQAIAQWKHIPLNRVPVVEAVTGIPRDQLRPDYPWTPAIDAREAAP